MKRVPAPAIAPLTEARFVTLTRGPQALEHHDMTDAYDHELFEAILDPVVLKSLWRTHGAAVHAEARRRGIAAPFWAEVEFGVVRR